MYYIIQENLFKEKHFDTLTSYLKRYKLDYEVIPFRPFTDEVEFNTRRKDVWCFGSVNLALVTKKYDWYPGSLYNDNHDLLVYGPEYGNNMLNTDGRIVNFADKIPDDFPTHFFARPTKDTKQFSGQLFSRESWDKWADDIENSNLKQSLTKETQILIASPKNIQQEIRCWIVDGKPVTISQYKVGSRVSYLNMDNNLEAIAFVEEMCALYCPAKAFVMDICLYNNEYKIVEINCINCSGFYDGDMSKLIQALENSFTI